MKTNNKSLFALVFVLLLTLFTITACGSSEDASSSEDETKSEEANKETEEASEEVSSDKPVELEFYYPVSVGGAIAEKVESYVEQFNQQNEGKIVVNPVFAGSYADTLTKAKTATEAGNSPDLGIFLQTDIFDLTDLDYVEPVDEFIAQEDESFIDDFYPALLDGSEIGGKRYSLPFQRSTQVLYYNKEVLKEAGVEKAPETWDELVEAGQKLVKEENGEVTRWGLQVPMGGPMGYWNIQPFALQNGVELANPEGTEVAFNDAKTIEAVQFFYDLAHEHKIMPEGPQGWGDIPTNFLAGNTAMMVHSTGSLTNVKEKAEFDFGVSMLPTNGGDRTNLGGGNLYIFKDIPQENKDAAWEFIKFLTSPEIAADWSMASGYIGVTKSAYETPELKAYVEEFPEAAVARDQLEEAGAELATHNNGKVTRAFSDEIDAVITGSKSVEDAMNDAQENAERALKGF